MPAGAMSVARPKKVRPSPPAEERAERETVIHMKGSPEYVEWVEKVHRATHIPKVQIFRLALADWAERNGHPSPPEI
jgi:hypothetical protein